MTERAAEFYITEARNLGVVPPPVFDGKSKPLLGEGQVLSTLAPGTVGQRVTREFKVVLDSTVSFIIAGTDAVPLYYDKTILASNERNVAAVTGAMLLARSAKGGRISDLAIEAIAPDELVLPGMLSAFGPPSNNPGIRDLAARRVFMIVSGILDERSYTPRPCAGIAGVYLNTRNHTKKATPHFVTGALSQAIARDWYRSHRGK